MKIPWLLRGCHRSPIIYYRSIIRVILAPAPLSKGRNSVPPLAAIRLTKVITKRSCVLVVTCLLLLLLHCRMGWVVNKMSVTIGCGREVVVKIQNRIDLNQNKPRSN